VSPRRVYLLVAACAVVVYIGALWNTYAGDDLEMVVHNDLVHSWSGVWRTFTLPYWQGEQGESLYRPLTVASYVLDWHLGDAVWFHAVNLAWHAAVSVLVAVLLYQWAGFGAALVSGVLFAVHPVHVEAVAGVVGRAELMAAAFALLAVYAAVERDSIAWSTVWWILGVLCKENAIVAPAIIGAAWALGLKRPPRRRMAWFAASWVVAGMAYAWVRWNILHTYPPYVAPVFFGQPPSTIRLTAIAALRDITRLLVFPLKLRIDYSPLERTAVTSIGDGRLIAGVVSLAAWGLWFALARQRRRPLEALGIAWIAIAFTPVANVLFPTGVLLAERTLYLPSIGLAVAAGALAAKLRGQRLALVVAAVALLGGVRTVLRVPVWRDEYTYISSVVIDSPRSYVGYMLSASILLLDRKDEQALDAAQTAIRIVPSDARSYVIAGHAALKLGRDSLANDLLNRADRACEACLSYYLVEADLARSLNDDAVADALLAHAHRARQR